MTVYVSAAHHRRGVGRALYVRLFALLAQQGYYEACAGITLPNDASVGLHESLGFRAGRRLPEHRVQVRRLARRRLVAEDAPAAVPDTPPAEPVPPPRIPR